MIGSPSSGTSWCPYGTWLLACAWLSTSGWILSALGCLNRGGYLVCALLALIPLTRWLRLHPTRRIACLRLPPRRRFRRLIPALYLTVLLMALAGGILFAPSNFDALNYRLPRMLHWLAEGGWHWIHTCNQAYNTRTVGTEWMSLPILLFTGSDRWLFLPNILSFSLLPGLVFAILARLGVHRRVAWHWMWIFPSGYCFALQAGGIGNDLPGVPMFLGGLLYALKARESRRWSHFSLACLGMALATGAKASNIPLGLPWIVALLPAVPLAWKFPIRTLSLTPVLLLSSFLPTAFLNHRQCGDWTGMKIEPVLMRGGDPALYLPWNTAYLLVQNLNPPVFPFAQAWNDAVESRIPAWLTSRLKGKFEPEASILATTETMMEENGPLGLGIVSLLAVGTAGSLVRRNTLPRNTTPARSRRLLWLVGTAALVSVLPALLKSGMTGSGRFLGPHYLLLVAPCLGLGGLASFLRSGLWRISAVACFLMLMGTMIVSAARPLWPALTVLNAVDARNSPMSLLRRAWDVYSVYRCRPDAFAPVRALLPDSAERIGFLSAITPESSLWKPFGKRRILHVTPSDSTDFLHRNRIRYLVAGRRTMEETGFPSLADWCSRHGATVVGQAEFPIMVKKGQDQWFVLKLGGSSVDQP